MIAVGGLTRLTDSGLSITEWELFSGILPPTNLEEWNRYFSLYKNIPQYQLINNSMSLDEFKIIFYWEYFHRMLGRIIGLFFLIPFIFFILIKIIDKWYLSNCFLILFLILLQGFVGWYMVKSGLVNNVSVSHYRLATHLVLAFFIISIIFWTLLNIINKSKNNFFINKNNNYLFYPLFFLMLLQIIFGAFVSGLDAGRIHQTWPLMNSSYFPDDAQINSIKDYFNFDNHALVQFYHRNIAYLISFCIIISGIVIFKKRNFRLFKPFYLVFTLLVVQIFLGVFTLISGLNIYLASVHQLFSLLLSLSLINLYYRYIN
tara:strand:+ start:167 stop:1117 length:951 start_codon:yes stop_codon:yes gene_type:complete